MLRSTAIAITAFFVSAAHAQEPPPDFLSPFSVSCLEAFSVVAVNNADAVPQWRHLRVTPLETDISLVTQATEDNFTRRAEIRIESHKGNIEEMTIGYTSRFAMPATTAMSHNAYSFVAAQDDFRRSINYFTPNTIGAAMHEEMQTAFSLIDGAVNECGLLERTPGQP